MTRTLFVSIVALVGSVPTYCAAEDQPRLPDVPWYDKTSGNLVPVFEPINDVTRPDRWESVTRPSNDRPPGPETHVLPWSGMGRVLIYLLFATGAVVLVRYLVSAKRGGSESLPTVRNQIPVTSSAIISDSSGGMDRASLLIEAKRAYQASDMVTAVQLYYAYQLHSLHASGIIRLMHHKTNRQYLDELRGIPAFHQPVSATVALCEAATFGGHVPSPQQFEGVWSQRDLFASDVTTSNGELS